MFASACTCTVSRHGADPHDDVDRARVADVEHDAGLLKAGEAGELRRQRVRANRQAVEDVVAVCSGDDEPGRRRCPSVSPSLRRQAARRPSRRSRFRITGPQAPAPWLVTPAREPSPLRRRRHDVLSFVPPRFETAARSPFGGCHQPMIFSGPSNARPLVLYVPPSWRIRPSRDSDRFPIICRQRFASTEDAANVRGVRR